jgi:hypothetical protein
MICYLREINVLLSTILNVIDEEMQTNLNISVHAIEYYFKIDIII